MPEEAVFDLWSDGYDRMTRIYGRDKGYPFEGRKELLGRVYSEIRRHSGKRVLDIGLDLGIVARRLYSAGCELCALESSKTLIGTGRKNMPEAELIQAEASAALPAELRGRSFDAIMSIYKLHRLPASEQYGFIEEALLHLVKGGMLIIGDIMFETRKGLEEAREKYCQDWYEDDNYLVLSEIQRRFSPYNPQIWRQSFCSAVFAIEKTDAGVQPAGAQDFY